MSGFQEMTVDGLHVTLATARDLCSARRLETVSAHGAELSIHVTVTSCEDDLAGIDAQLLGQLHDLLCSRTAKIEDKDVDQGKIPAHFFHEQFVLFAGSSFTLGIVRIVSSPPDSVCVLKQQHGVFPELPAVLLAWPESIVRKHCGFHFFLHERFTYLQLTQLARTGIPTRRSTGHPCFHASNLPRP